MGQTITVTAEDGHAFDAYRAAPEGAARGGIIVVQEIFGVNHHIRAVTDGYAAAGYVAVAPALFDRVERGVELDYTPEEIETGRALMGKLSWDDAVQDTRAVADLLRPEVGAVGCVGYCWGGTVAWLAATRIGIPSVGYYGGGTAGLVDEQPRAPVILHFGEHDDRIPMADVDAIRAAHPDVPVHVFPAGHGFNCDARGSYHADSAAAALELTLAFFKEHVG
ncbi:MAG: dienelactone hydrolase family protein [Alphaproteobacteria bacterium]|nr:dienelactone hydrolase family protein [Alphaproteobacteria bacterium]